MSRDERIEQARNLACESFGAYLSLQRSIRLEPVHPERVVLDHAFEIWQKATRNYHALLGLYERQGGQSRH